MPSDVEALRNQIENLSEGRTRPTSECRHDMAPGFQGYSDTRIDMHDVIVWSRRHLICRKCEMVRENDGSEKFSIDWAMALLYSHFR